VGAVVLVVVVNNVDRVDEGCATMVGSDMTDSGGDRGLGAASLRGAICISASAVEVEGVI
jgi:hypothetical protein